MCTNYSSMKINRINKFKIDITKFNITCALSVQNISICKILNHSKDKKILLYVLCFSISPHFSPNCSTNAWKFIHLDL